MCGLQAVSGMEDARVRYMGLELRLYLNKGRRGDAHGKDAYQRRIE